MADLSGLFRPGRVAVVGPTDREGAVGIAITKNLEAGFDRTVVPVNPSRDELLGLPSVTPSAAAGDVADPRPRLH
jgi:acetyltransferase